MKLTEWIRKSLDENDILQKNEVQANKLAGFTMFLGSVLLAVVLVLCASGIFHLKADIFPKDLRHVSLDLQ